MLDGKLEDDVLTALCWNEALAGPIIQRLGDPNLFSSEPYRIIARAAFQFHAEHHRPPKVHIENLLEHELKRGNHGRFLEETIGDMEKLAPNLNEEYVLGQLDLFIDIQRLTKAVEQASGNLLNCPDRPSFIQTCHGLDSAIHPYLDDDLKPSAELPWPILDEAALHGLAGEVVRMIAPHTEADPAALLGTFLIGFGNYIGRSIYFEVEGARHHGNLSVIIVGDSSKARKGSSLRRIKQVLLYRDASDWQKCWFQNALGSGEGLIYRVRDQDGDEAGAADKRLFLVVEELATQLRIMERSGSSISGILRLAWDGDILTSPMIKAKQIRATGAHISMLAHSTVEDLKSFLTSTDLYNGFANRQLFICAKASNPLPMGGNLSQEDIDTLSGKIDRAARFAEAHAGEIKLDSEAREIWEGGLYETLWAARPGVFGSVAARGETQVRRMALLYSALDQSPITRADHLLAAAATWEYAFYSAYHIFGNATGHGSAADKIMAALRLAPSGLKRTEIYALFSNHQSGQRIGHALEALAKHNLAECKRESSGGRPGEIWRAIK